MALKKLGAAAVILDTEGRALLVRHSYEHRAWELPGGDAESGESLEETALREVREETGMEVSVERLSGVYYDIGTDYHQAVFVCHLPDEAMEPVPDGGEIGECRYWRVDTLPHPISDYTIRRIADARNGPMTPGIVRIPSPTYA